MNDLVRELGYSQPTVSKHLRVLREVGLVRVRGEGKWRVYRLDPRALEPIHEWVGGFREFWAGSFDRLDDYIRETEADRVEE